MADKIVSAPSCSRRIRRQPQAVLTSTWAHRLTQYVWPATSFCTLDGDYRCKMFTVIARSGSSQFSPLLLARFISLCLSMRLPCLQALWVGVQEKLMNVQNILNELKAKIC